MGGGVRSRGKCRRPTEIVAVMACAILALCNCLVCPDVFWPIAVDVVVAVLATHLAGFLFFYFLFVCCSACGEGSFLSGFQLNPCP